MLEKIAMRQYGLKSVIDLQVSSTDTALHRSKAIKSRKEGVDIGLFVFITIVPKVLK